MINLGIDIHTGVGNARRSLTTLLDYNFRARSYWENGNIVTEDDAVTVTRATDKFATAANGQLFPFSANELARSNLGALIESAATNSLLRSQEFDNVTWVKDNSGATTPVVTANYGAAPDGTTTADRFQLDKTGGTLSRVYQLTSIPSAIYTFSIWLKTTNGGVSNLGIRVSTTDKNVVVSDTWQRFSINLPSAETNPSVQVLLLDSIAGNDETADILVWGAQLETGAVATSYIPTTGSAATRNYDLVKFHDTALANTGTIVFKFKPAIGWFDRTSYYLRSASGKNSLYSNPSTNGLTAYDGAVEHSYGDVTEDQDNIVAFAFSPSGMTSSLNGAAVVSSLTVITLTGGDLFLGSAGSSATTSLGTIESIQFLSTEESDASLIALATS